MSIPEELKKELHEEFERHLEAARQRPMTPGSLEAIMILGAERMGRLTQEALAQAASSEAGFPPSGVSALRRGKEAREVRPQEDADSSGSRRARAHRTARRRGAQRERLDAEITYTEAGRKRMDYARYEAAGWPIGSGVIEGTCKHLVKQRMCVTGARWRRAHIAPVLALRVVIGDDEWDEARKNRQAA